MPLKVVLKRSDHSIKVTKIDRNFVVKKTGHKGQKGDVPLYVSPSPPPTNDYLWVDTDEESPHFTADNVFQTPTSRFTNDADIARLENTSGVNTGDQDISYLATRDELVAGLSTKVGAEHDHTVTDITDLTPLLNAKADRTYVEQAVADLVDTSPEALNTLNELANALGDDPNFATTVSNQIGEKADKTYVDSQDATKATKQEIPQYNVPVRSITGTGEVDAYRGWTSAATAGTFAYRGTGGVVSVGTPTATDHATTKAYVDSALSINPYTVPFRNNSVAGPANEFVSLNHVSATAFSIARRNNTGAIDTGTPTADTHATTKAYVDTVNGNKVDKTSTASQVYITNASGAQTTLKYSQFSDGNAIPQRDSGGRLFTPTPTISDHVASKGYVDSVGSAQLSKAGDTANGNINFNGGVVLGPATERSHTSLNKVGVDNKRIVQQTPEGYIGLSVVTSNPDIFYLADRKSGWTATMTGATAGTVDKLFNGNLSDNVRKDVSTLATNPLIITVEASTTIDYTDVLRLAMYGHRGTADGWLTDYKIETKGSDNNWHTAIERVGGMDRLGYFQTGLHLVGGTYPDASPGYHAFRGVRITITGAVTGDNYAGHIAIGELCLIESRGAGKPSAGVNALDIGGGTLYGDLGMNGNKIFSVGTPTVSTDAVNKAYVDSNIIRGTGFPNGTVTANVGTIYIDTAVTNGASSWFKKTGTGNTGWQVMEGDTGWRNVGSLLNGFAFSVQNTSTSYIHIRRIGNMIHLLGRIDTKVTTTTTAHNMLDFNVLSGFKSHVEFPPIVEYNAITSGWNPLNKLVGRSAIGQSSHEFAQFSTGWNIAINQVYSTLEAWPQTLPGTAV